MAAQVPDGPQVYLEVADLGLLLQQLTSGEARLGKLKGSEAGRQFLQGKIPLKLADRLRDVLEGPFGKGGLGRVSRSLAFGRGAMAVYDIESLRVLMVFEDPKGARGMALVGQAKEPPRKETRGGRSVEVVGAAGKSLYLSRSGGWLRIASHPEDLDRALDASSPRLAADPGFQRQAGALPTDLLRFYLSAGVFETVYMRNYWAGGHGSPLPAQAVGAALTRLPTGYREIRRRDAGELVPRPSVRGLARFLPAWTFREVSGGPAPEDVLDLLVATPETPAGRSARNGLVETFQEWAGAARSWGTAGGLLEADPGAFAVGDAPADGFSETWPPASGLHSRARAVVALEFAPGEGPDAAAAQEAFTKALRGDLGPAGKRGVPQEVADLQVEVAREGDVLILACGPGALGAARVGSAPALGEDRPDLVGAFAVDGAALRREARTLVGASEARSEWWARRAGEFVKDFLAGPLDGSLADLRRVRGLRLARAGGGAEELVEYDLAR
jgi:hypothetical protein